MNDLYNIKLNGDTRGPFTESQLRSMWANGALTADTYFSRQGEDVWFLLAELCESKPQAHPPTDVTAPTSEISKPASIPSPTQKKFLWSPVVLFAVVSICIWMLYASDGCQHTPELPSISKGSRDAPVSLRSTDITKLTGEAYSHQGSFSANFYNGSVWNIGRVDVILTKKKTFQSRRFRLSPRETSTEFDPITMKVVEKKIEPIAKPFSEASFQGEVGDFLDGVEQGEWTWNIVEAFGFR